MAEIIIGLIIFGICSLYHKYQANRKPQGNLSEEEIKKLFGEEAEDN